MLIVNRKTLPWISHDDVGNSEYIGNVNRIILSCNLH